MSVLQALSAEAQPRTFNRMRAACCCRPVHLRHVAVPLQHQVRHAGLLAGRVVGPQPARLPVHVPDVQFWHVRVGDDDPRGARQLTDLVHLAGVEQHLVRKQQVWFLRKEVKLVRCKRMKL